MITVIRLIQKIKVKKNKIHFNNILDKTGLTENSAGAALLGLLGVVLAAIGFRRKR